MSGPTRPLTIGHVVLSLDVGGLERVVALLARAQHEAESRVRVYCLDRAGVLAAPLPDAGVAVRTVRRRAGGFDAASVLRLARMLRADGVDVVHCHNHGALLYGAPAARLARCARVIYTVHGARTSERRSTARFLKLGLVQEVVFVSAHARATARAAGLSGDAHVHIVVNGVDLRAFNAGAADGARIRRELGIDPGARVCGIVARLTPAKDHRTLLSAMARLRADHSGVHCVVVGDGELREELVGRSAELGLDAAVHFTGARDNVGDYLAGMNVFVLSSVTEGLAVALLEAMAAGLPVVATRVGGNPEVVADGVTGLLVEPGNDAALAAAIASLFEDPARAMAMGAAGRERVRGHFGLDSMVRRYREIYEAAAHSPVSANR